MYVERVKYQLEKNDEWKVGYWIGSCYNHDDSILLDKNYKLVTTRVWDFKTDYENRLVFSVSEKEDFE